MIKRYLLGCLLLLTAVLVNSQLQQVTNPQFQQITKANEWVLTYFYGPHCGECIHIEPQIEALHQISLEKHYKVVKIDCHLEHQLCNSLKIKGFPSIILFANTHPIIYNKQKQAFAIDTWIASIQSEKFTKIDSFTLKSKEGKQKFVLFGGLSSEQSLLVTATKLSRFIGIPFYEIQSKQPILSFYQTDGSNKIDYTFPIDPPLMAYQLFHRSRDHVMSLQNKNYLDYFKNQKDSEQIIVFYNHFDSLTESAERVLASVCHQHLVTILCFKIDIKSLHYNTVAVQFNPPDSQSTIVYSTQNKYHAYFYNKSKVIESQFRLFLKAAKGKKITANYDKEAQIRKKITYKHATVLTEDTHNSTIKDNKFVFVQYYSPYCGYCVFLAPKYDELAKQAKQIGLSVVVAAIDLTKQQKVGNWQDIQGYPTIKLFIQGTALQYKGQRSTEALLEYLTEIVRARLLVAPSLKDITESAIIITGIDSQSALHSLPALFSTLPVYHLTSQAQFSLTIQNKQIKRYTGKAELLPILNWLQTEASQVLVSLGSAKVPKKLQLAMNRKKPILAIINKGQEGSIKHILDLLTDYCSDITEFVCGYANKGEADYDHLVQWIADPNPTSNRIVWINTRDLKCYLYEDNLTELTKQKIAAFVNNIKKGIVKEHISPKKQQEKQNQQPQQTDQDQEEVEKPNNENEEL